MRNIVKIIVSVAAIALSLLLGLNAEKLFVKNLDLVTIPIPNREIEPYTILSEDMFTTKEFTSYLKDFDYAESFSQLDGRMTTSTLAQGLPVPMAFISQSTGFYMDDPKLEIVSVPVMPSQMVGGNVYPGQNINLYVMEKGKTAETSSAPSADPFAGSGENLFQLPTAVQTTAAENSVRKISNLKVSAVLDQYGKDIYVSEKNSPADRYAAILVLAVRPDQTESIVKAAVAAENDPDATKMWVTIANTK